MATNIERIEKLERDNATLTWLLAGLLHELRMMMAQQVLQNPAVQQQLQQQLAATMQGGTNGNGQG